MPISLICWYNVCSGLIPTANMTVSASSARRTPSLSTTGFPPSTPTNLVFVSSPTPESRSLLTSTQRLVGPTSAATRSSISTIVTFLPCCTRYSAVSQPTIPPPIINTDEPVCLPRSTSRAVIMSPTPGKLGTIGWPPTASTTSSKPPPTTSRAPACLPRCTSTEVGWIKR